MGINKAFFSFQKLKNRLNLLSLPHKHVIKMDSKAVKLKTIQK